MIGKMTSRLKAPGRGGELVVASFWSMLLRGSGMLATFVLGIQLARYLGPAEYGVYGLVIAAAMLLSSIGQLGLPTLATREVALAWSRRDYPQLRGIFRWFGLACLAASALLAAGFAGAAVWLPAAAGSFGPAAVIGAPLIPLFALTVLVSAELRAVGRLVLGQSLEILVRPLSQSILCLIVFLAVGALTARSALVLNVVASALALLLAMYWLRRELPAPARAAHPKHHAHQWLRSAAPLAVTDVLRQLDGVYALLLMGTLTSDIDTGIFRVAQASMMLVATPLFVVHIVVAPTLARLHHDGEQEKLQALVGTAAVANTIVAIIGTLVIAVGGPELVSLVFGPAYAPAFGPLLILCFSQIASGLFGVGFVLLPMTGGGRELTIGFAVSVGVSIIVAVPLILTWGAIGAAVAAVVGWTVNGLVVRYFTRKRLGIETTPLGMSWAWFKASHHVDHS